MTALSQTQAIDNLVSPRSQINPSEFDRKTLRANYEANNKDDPTKSKPLKIIQAISADLLAKAQATLKSWQMLASQQASSLKAQLVSNPQSAELQKERQRYLSITSLSMRALQSLQGSSITMAIDKAGTVRAISVGQNKDTAYHVSHLISFPNKAAPISGAGSALIEDAVFRSAAFTVTLNACEDSEAFYKSLCFEKVNDNKDYILTGRNVSLFLKKYGGRAEV